MFGYKCYNTSFLRIQDPENAVWMQDLLMSHADCMDQQKARRMSRNNFLRSLFRVNSPPTLWLAISRVQNHGAEASWVRLLMANG
jgi:hypothetical protein